MLEFWETGQLVNILPYIFRAMYMLKYAVTRLYSR